MKKALMMLLALAIVAAGGMPSDALANAKKKPVAAKKTHPRVAGKAKAAGGQIDPAWRDDG